MSALYQTPSTEYFPLRKYKVKWLLFSGPPKQPSHNHILHELSTPKTAENSHFFGFFSCFLYGYVL